jgi:biopolymer transport protein ExbB
MNPILSMLQQGGILMIPIIAASIVSLFVFFERLWSLRPSKVIPVELVHLVLDRSSEGKYNEAMALCEGSGSTASALIHRGLMRRGAARAQMKEALEEIGQIEVSYLGRYIELLGTIATIAPLMGLLGTVIGMIDVFRAVVSEVSAHGGMINPASLASGIWAALITTAAGLSAAIPAFLGYKYLLGHVERLAVELEEIGLSLLETVYPTLSSTESSSPPLDQPAQNSRETVGDV